MISPASFFDDSSRVQIIFTEVENKAQGNATLR